MKKSLPFFKISFILLIVFILFTFLVFLNFFENIDILATIFLQNVLPRTFDTELSLFSLLGSVEFLGIFLLIMLVVYRKLNWFFVLLYFALFHFIELFGKTFIDHLGPPHEFFRYTIPFNFPSSLVQPGSSYPSGHSGRMAFILVIIIFILWNSKLPKNQKLVLGFAFCVFSLIMFFSRIYLGEHWLSDVIGGILLGGASGLISLNSHRINPKT